MGANEDPYFAPGGLQYIGDYEPKRATIGSAGYDLQSAENLIIKPNGRAKIPTGLRVQIARGLVGLLRGRSSLSSQGLLCAEGTIDSDYRGEVFVPVWNTLNVPWEIFAGDRIAQLVLVKCFTGFAIKVEQLEETHRGAGGFGSSGR